MVGSCIEVQCNAGSEVVDIVEYRDFCLSLPGVTEETPFGPDTLVYKVMGKMFAVSGIDIFDSFNAKATPEDCIALREQYEGVKPGWHMNKKHWNTIMTDGSVPDKVMYDLIRNSYDLVVASLTKKLKAELDELRAEHK